MSFLEHFDRGGQVSMHRLRMRMQNFKIVLYTALMISFSYFGIKVYWDVHPYAWDLALEKIQADVYTSLPGEAKYTMEQRFKRQDGRYVMRRCMDISRDPLANYSHTHIMEHVLSKAWQSLLVFISACGFLFSFFMMRGKKKFKKKENRGTSFLKPHKLASLMRKKKIASDLTIEGVPLVKDAETQHTLVTGTTGAGKTNFFQALLPQIRERGDKALIVDVTGDYVSRYYREGKDILINPFDTRSAKWDLWKELCYDYDYDTFARACMTKNSFSGDSFWDTAGFKILSSGLKKMAQSKKPSLLELYKILSRISLKEFANYFRGTEATAFTDEENEKTTLSVRATLSAHIEFLRHLETRSEKTFSFKDWVENDEDKRWVFLTCRADQRETLRPLFTALLNLAIIRILSLEPSSQRKIWLALDELPALHKVPALESGLAEGRKYGLCFLGGFQSMAQLQKLYGNHGAESMLDLLNTKILFRSNDIKTQDWISKTLGRTEETKVSENISYGAHSMRDGVSLNETTRTKSLIMTEEVGKLENLMAYIKLPGSLPITHITMGYNPEPENVAPRFVQDPLKFLDVDNTIVSPKKKEKVEKADNKKTEDPSIEHIEEKDKNNEPGFH